MQIELLLQIDAPPAGAVLPAGPASASEFEAALAGTEGRALGPPGAPPPGMASHPQVEEALPAEPIALGSQLDFPLLDALDVAASPPCATPTEEDAPVSDLEPDKASWNGIPLWSPPLDVWMAIGGLGSPPAAGVAPTMAAPSGLPTESPIRMGPIAPDSTGLLDLGFATRVMDPPMPHGSVPGMAPKVGPTISRPIERPDANRPAASTPVPVPASPSAPTADPLTLIATGTQQTGSEPMLPREALQALNPTEIAADPVFFERPQAAAPGRTPAEPQPSWLQTTKNVPASARSTTASGTADAIGASPDTSPRALSAQEPNVFLTKPATYTGRPVVEQPGQAEQPDATAIGEPAPITESSAALAAGAEDVFETEPLEDAPADEGVAPATRTMASHASALSAHAQRAVGVAQEPSAQPASHDDVRRAVAERIESLASTRKGATVRIRLEPEELGVVVVTVRASANRVDAEISASNDSVRAGMEAGKGQLAQIVESKGVTLGSLQIESHLGADAQANGRQPYEDARQEMERQANLRAARAAAPSHHAEHAWTPGGASVDYRI